MKRILLLALALLPATVLAVPVTVTWELPTMDCDGQPVAPEVIEQMEIYISAGPIPAMDVSCPSPGDPVDAVPETFSSRIEVTATNGSTDINLFGGETYHIRARVRTADGWSNLSSEATKEIPAAPVEAPVIISVEF